MRCLGARSELLFAHTLTLQRTWKLLRKCVPWESGELKYTHAKSLVFFTELNLTLGFGLELGRGRSFFFLRRRLRKFVWTNLYPQQDKLLSSFVKYSEALSKIHCCASAHLSTAGRKVTVYR